MQGRSQKEALVFRTGLLIRFFFCSCTRRQACVATNVDTSAQIMTRWL